MEGNFGSKRSVATAQRLDFAIRRLRGRLRTESGMYSIGLTITQLSVLRSVVDKGPITAARLATLEHVSPQSIAQSLAVLKAARLVRGEPDPQDRRKTLISADSSAAELITSLLAGRESFLARAIDHVVAPEERKDLEKAIELLERLAAVDLSGGV
ncbi:MarR family transcriptional regulator [Actinoallomurus purpureus]|uniref:MarR family winged helix-turn-helix transcriptional regulator n=1 Tax=Actinoallomurus purpureus TaxID=478114 RepID=UPI002093AEE8|nr:MarR family transcriptional regulator [Actinoallomurus purpureus]MCO6003513.1 MarR family transcriptional regulator [Actinoallomurus purpureus]